MTNQLMHACYGINAQGHLTIGGLDTLSLAKQYGTPAYVMDEDFIRATCRIYREALERAYGADGGMALFAGKALCFRQIYRIMAEEGLGADLVSPGEIYTAHAAGFPMEKTYFHGNNKTPEDLDYALSCGVGCIVVDSMLELDRLESAAVKAGKKVKVLLRVTPGIDPHTHKAISTGRVDSKFGMAIATGQAEQAVLHARTLPHLDLAGLHCHIGSQIFDSQPFCDAADIMIDFLAHLHECCGFTARELDLGGGFGVRYVATDRSMDYAATIAGIAEHIRSRCVSAGLAIPKILMEPGRSLVAAAGLTLYTVGYVKEIPGFRTYVSIDGGMPDNPRYALYGSAYTAWVANRANEAQTLRCTLAGRCCESGDLIGEDMQLQSCHPGDTLAVLVTGAYNYSMASNYNRIPRPPVILIRQGKARVAVARETYDDLMRLDLADEASWN